VFLIVVIHILIFIVLSVHIHCFIYICVQGYLLVPLSLGVLLSQCMLLIDFHIYKCALIIKFNSIQLQAKHCS